MGKGEHSHRNPFWKEWAESWNSGNQIKCSGMKWGRQFCYCYFRKIFMLGAEIFNDRQTGNQGRLWKFQTNELTGKSIVSLGYFRSLSCYIRNEQSAVCGPHVTCKTTSKVWLLFFPTCKISGQLGINPQRRRVTPAYFSGGLLTELPKTSFNILFASVLCSPSGIFSEWSLKRL